jgi:8-hydroxy-5-deazaflavin:NADPH oxidoreductase
VQLIGDVGFEPFDLGPLKIACYGEPFALLIGQLAYETSSQPGVAYRFEHFDP